MIDPLTLSEAGMLNDVERLRVLSQNIANSATLGFKREIPLLRPAFETALQANWPNAVPAPVTATAMDATGGPLRMSGGPLDVAVDGDGFFVLKSPAGEVYTRQGTFRLDPNGRLVSSSGLPVLGDAGELVLPSPEPRIDRQGAIWDGTNLVGQLRVVRFDDPTQLISIGNGMFTTRATPSVLGESARVRQGFVETANVIAMHEMVRLIETVRHFEAGQRVVRGYDTMLGTALSTLGSL